jgi:hypothetical protein
MRVLRQFEMSWSDFTAAVATLANSNFTTSLIGSLAGAFAGAWAAQRISEKAKTRELLLKEIRHLNAAATILYGVANTHIGLKKQHVKKLHDDFEEERKRFELLLKAKNAGTVPPKQVFEFVADMQTLNPPYFPVEQITRLMFDELSLPADLLVTPHLLSSVQTLAETLESRNVLIREWRDAQLEPDVLAALYFGAPRGQVVDVRYRTAVDGIDISTENIIAFSMMLADSLVARLRKTVRSTSGSSEARHLA